MSYTNDLDDLQVFALPEGPRHPADIAARLMLDPEHAHLKDNEISIGYLMRLHSKEKGGKTELGSMHDAKYMAQGGFKELFAQLPADHEGRNSWLLNFGTAAPDLRPAASDDDF